MNLTDYLVQAYDAVLGLFYHRPIDFGPFAGTGLQDILQMSSDCLEVAEYLEVASRSYASHCYQTIT